MNALIFECSFADIYWLRLHFLCNLFNVKSALTPNPVGLQLFGDALLLGAKRLGFSNNMSLRFY
ncbi:hypothetical protein BM607_019900 [Shewanella sp. SACH]|nr:hypothetical protein C8I07_06240 [Shewanella baltica]OUS49996.1 hypothetical protein BM607_019900 [Shewanella sp. SACH]HCE51062.1 hypothetical protein [Shewanella baltica]